MAKLCLGRRMYLSAFVFLLISGFSLHAQVANHPMGTSPLRYVNPFQFGIDLNDISFVDNNNGLGVSIDGAITKTTDGGYTWDYIFYKVTSATNQVGFAVGLNDVHFVTPTVAYIVGLQGMMLKSTDGGVNWTKINTPLTPFNKNINAIHFLNKDTGYIAGQSLLTSTTTNDPNAMPKIYFTRNGGATWDSLVSPFRPQQNTPANSAFINGEIQRLHFVNDSIGYAVGNCPKWFFK